MTHHEPVIGRPLREEWQKAHIWTHPSIWEETSCRTAMEAMTARAAMVTSNHGALSETCCDFAYMYPFIDILKEHVERFADELDQVMDNYWDSEVQNNLNAAKTYADTFYNWEYRSKKWIEMFELMEIDYELTEDATEGDDGSTNTVDGDNDGGVRGTDSGVQ